MPRPHAVVVAIALCIAAASSVAASPGPGLESAATLPPASWSPHGAQADAKFGSSVAPAGDVNGDGFGDVLVGAPGFGNGQANEGQARLYYGTATGLSDVAGWTWESNQVGALGGACVAPAGDVNLDGYQDFLVGAPSWDEPGLPNTGAVFVFYGSATGPPAVANVKLLNFIIESTFGTSAGTAGDVNGDQYADVVVGAPLYSNGPFNQGACFVFHGSAAGLSTTPARILEGGLAGAHFGAAVSTAGDVNGDGFADIVVGAPAWSGSVYAEGGKAYAFAGSVTGIETSARWSVEGVRDSSHYGAAVANAGDVNGDGYADVLIGNPGADLVFSGTPKGAADLLRGNGAFTLSAGIVSLGGDSAHERFGIAVATAGDLNGDGYADFAIGGDRWSGSGTQRGHVAVYLGGKNVHSYLTDLFGNVSGDAFGASVATSGDVNGDGFSELVVGDPEASPALAREGRARLFLGRASDPVVPAGWPRTGSGVGTSYGQSVAILPHIDESTYASVVISESGFSGAVSNSGRFTIHAGQLGGVSGSIAYTREGLAVGDRIAERVANVGDVDHDTFTDLLVSSINYQTDATQAEEGRVWLYRGTSESGPQLANWVAEGNQAGAQFGEVIAGAGDVNGDGYADVLIGAPVWDSATLVDCGKAVLYLGGPAGLGAPSWTREGTVAGQGFGAAVALAGDLDGDGYSDVAISSQPYDIVPSGSSKVDVFFGSPAGLPANPQWTFVGNTITYGYCVAGIGDFSGDGVSDLAIGAPEDNGFGRVFIYLGSRARAFPAAPRWSVGGNQTSAHFGFAIAGGGDVNGDGIADLVIAEPSYSNGQSSEGRLHLFFGGATGATLVPVWQYESNLAEDQMGNSLAPLGDLDSDGFADIVAGSAAQAGRAYIQLGGGIGVTRRYTQTEWNAVGAPRWAPDLSDSPYFVGIRQFFRSAAGRDRVGGEFEIVTQTTPFANIATDSYPFGDTQAPQFLYGSVTNGGGAHGGLSPGTAYHWQARTVSRSPYFPHSRWQTTDAKHTGDLDFRTSGSSVGVTPTEPAGGVPRLTRIAPNPSAAESQIAFWLPAPGHATIDVFDTQGRHVRRVAAGEWTGGLTVRPWDGKDGGGRSVAAGVYYVELRSGTLVDRAKLVRVR